MLNRIWSAALKASVSFTVVYTGLRRAQGATVIELKCDFLRGGKRDVVARMHSRRNLWRTI